MIKKIIYVISIFSLVFLTFLTVQMLPIVLKAKWQGILFLISQLLLLLFELIVFIKNKNLIKTAWSYNVFVIAASMYLSIVYYKIYSYKLILSSNYVDINYCKDNYLILTSVFILIIVNLIFIINDKKKYNKTF